MHNSDKQLSEEKQVRRREHWVGTGWGQNQTQKSRRESSIWGSNEGRALHGQLQMAPWPVRLACVTYWGLEHAQWGF